MSDDCPCVGGIWANGTRKVPKEYVEKQARLAALREVREAVEKLGSWARTRGHIYTSDDLKREIDAMIAKEEGKP